MSSSLTVNDHTLNWGSKTYIMGILNLTPDSFSGDGLVNKVSETGESELDLDAILEKAGKMVDNGADIIDIGGESTRPGSQLVSAEKEMQRVLPVVEKLAANLDAIISIDTYKASVAEEAIKRGAHIVNDIWGLHADSEMANIVAKYNRSSWAHAEIKEKLGGRYVGIPYENLVEDIRRELLESVDIARKAGIPDDHIILDPGIGFGKSVEQNLELLDRLNEIKALGFPVLLGPSRKSFIGYTLNTPPDQRIEGTAAAVAVGIVRGADVVRVHDVAFMSMVVRITDAIIRRENSY
jgi:dihydropteroate synthase